MASSFRYDLGDLIKYQEYRWTEEYRDVVHHIGVVTAQRYCFSTCNRFKIRTATSEKWISADHIVEVLSSTK